MRRLRAAPQRPGRWRAWSIGVVLCMLPAATASAKKTALPYTLDVDVRTGAESVSERVRGNLEIELIGELDRVGCFERVERFVDERAGEGALMLRLTVADVERENFYDSSMAQRFDPDAPPEADQGMMASVEARIELELLVLPERSALKRKQFTVMRRLRPTLGSDAKLQVEFDMIQEVTRAARSWACKDSPKKLGQRIAAVREAGDSR